MSEMDSVISKLARQSSEITIKGEKVAVRPTPRDAELFLVVASGNFDEMKAVKVTQIMKSIIKRANPDVSEEDLDAFVAANYGEIFFELAVLFGFTTRDQIDQFKKKAISKVTSNQ